MATEAKRAEVGRDSLDLVARRHQQPERMRVGQHRLAILEEHLHRHMGVAHRRRVIALGPGAERIGDEGAVLEQVLFHWRPPVLAIAPLKSKWMPHSFLLSPRQRPARGSSPSATIVVHGAQPIDL